MQSQKFVFYRNETITYRYKKKKFSFCNQSGFGLIEVMIFALVVALVSIAISVSLKELREQTQRQQLLQTISSLKKQIESVINSPRSWINTVNNNANMSCLQAQVKPFIPCPAPYVNSTALNSEFVDNSAAEIVLYDGAAVPGNVYFDGRKTANNGFTLQGARCTGFSINPPGNDACPIGFVINWRAGSAGILPKVVVNSRLIFNPTDKNPYKKLLNANIDSPTETLNTNYDAQSIRTQLSPEESFTAIIPYNIGGSGCGGGAFVGTCDGVTPIAGFVKSITNNAIENHIATNQNDKIPGPSDPYDLIDILPGGATIILRHAGQYTCKVTTYSFATNSVTTRLINQTLGTTLLTQFSNSSSNVGGGVQGEMARIVTEGTFNIAADNTALQLVQTCQTVSSCPLGFSISSVPIRIQAAITCIKGQQQ